MKFSKLLAARQRLVREAHLATVAQAYFTLSKLATRVARVSLRGRVRLQPADPRVERYWPTLTALAGSQAQIEEHFSDEDVMELAEAAVLVVEANYENIEFSLEELADHFVVPLRSALAQAGVAFDLDQAEPRSSSSSARERR
jgi:hypothetical protein